MSGRYLLHNALDRKVGAHIEEGDAGGRILAVCDFAAFPLSYDIIYFLAAANAFRDHAGAKWMDIAFVAHDSDPQHPFPEQGNPVQNGDYRTFVHNLGVNASRVFPFSGDVLFFSNRSNFLSFWGKARKTHRLFPESYSPYSPDYIPSLNEPPLYGMVHVQKYDAPTDVVFPIRVPENAKKLIRAWISVNAPGKRIITVTLRETPYQPSRNSNMAEWQKLVHHYRGQSDLRFVVLRDYYSLYTTGALMGENVIECPEAVLDIPLRAALYEEAELNLFVPNGPAALCFFNSRTRYLVFDMGGPELAVRAEDILHQHGVRPGEKFKGASSFQRLIWAEDDFSVMCAEVDSILEELSGKPRKDCDS